MQEGIFYQQGATPGKHWGLLFLRINEGYDSTKIYEGLNSLWEVLQALKVGKIEDLPNITVPVPPSGLQITIGYGKNIFNKTGIKKFVPTAITDSNFRPPLATGGGKLLAASGLSYSETLIKNPATEDIALQFISDSELLIYRCYLESYKLLTTANNEFPFEIVKFYTGFQREDKRSWIDFHDGISNLKSGKDRFEAIRIKENNIPEEQWIIGGTFMAFMRIEVDIDKWIKLDRATQELLVGRDKVSGCPLDSVMDDRPIIISKCPFSETTTIVDLDSKGNFINEDFFEPSNTSDPIVLASHVQRANHHKQVIGDRDSLRVFRQGYEFFEASDQAAKIKIGLNFVSFQDTPERLIRMLTQETWLGNVNFGGLDNHQTPENNILKIWAAGIYLIPPENNLNKIPGYELFE
ncbi:Dyp-type peroxidase [Acinetobacter sp. C26M]|uniref:Dyp-type peroxidase n=1 Tax=unclassified Acinetobacter TaxID=196816 RepID=UPI002036FFF7|nr:MULTISPECIES: Dyp-type peroxidase domain-containing protein [unclassified Acinetobacter]USA47222.1 Dyp-type peroxidase [Acinetobacter sp. C26M]USA50703.1 Dyp-type peroxidase [Acinetobacter sp. C26G]